jgi:hypothetical protein
LFCPNCKLEYRAGFTRCSDCDVDLVVALPKAAAAREVGVHDLRSPVVLRRGITVSDAAIIREALNAASLPFNTRQASAEIVADGTPSYEFWVNAEDRPNASSVMDAALEAAGSNELPENGESADVTDASASPSDQKASESDDEGNDDADSDSVDELAAEDDELGNIGDDELTAEAWSGATGDLAGMLKMCLREVGIASRASRNGSRERLLVAEADLSRSREIIREVIEAAPPE